ncbi:MAG: hypothetical protein DWC02_00645 [Candidatus Poseidoniales archaeon]|nr:MAG: hypothetical protein DWC02_00645 [Candidatus Poseidoniales archaeon]
MGSDSNKNILLQIFENFRASILLLSMILIVWVLTENTVWFSEFMAEREGDYDAITNFSLFEIVFGSAIIVSILDIRAWFKKSDEEE